MIMKFVKTTKDIEQKVEKFLKGLYSGYSGRINIGVEPITKTKDYINYHTTGYELKVYDINHWTSNPNILFECVATKEEIYFYSDDEEGYVSFNEVKKILTEYLEKELSQL